MKEISDFAYEHPEIYKALTITARRHGFDTFAVIFISQEKQCVVKPVKLPKIEELMLEEAIDSL